MRKILHQFLPPRMCLQRAPRSRRTLTPPRKHPGTFHQSWEISTIQNGQTDSWTGYYLSRIFLNGANNMARVEYTTTIRCAEFENPSLTAIPVLFSGCMNAYGCIPDVTKNLFYSSVVLVDVLPCDGSSQLAARNESHQF
jgi:hypothetical protein